MRRCSRCQEPNLSQTGGVKLEPPETNRAASKKSSVLVPRAPQTALMSTRKQSPPSVHCLATRLRLEYWRAAVQAARKRAGVGHLV